MTTPSGPVRAEAIRQVDAIETELRRLGMWDLVPPPDGTSDAAPFGGSALPFEGWLQHVFVARARAVLAGHGQWPASSQVGVAAMRAFDGVPGTDGLVSRLHAFDRLITGTPP